MPHRAEALHPELGTLAAATLHADRERPTVKGRIANDAGKWHRAGSAANAEGEGSVNG